MIYFISDTHFYHQLMSEMRNFESVSQMNDSLIEKWNSVVKKNDVVYHLGDFSFGKKEESRKIRFKLNGKIHLILGNHDYKNQINKLDCFSSINDMLTLKYCKQKIILCHYRMMTWDSSHYNAWHLYGHTHNSQLLGGKAYNVTCDLNKCIPISIEEIFCIMHDLPDNFNLIKKSDR